MSRESEQKSKKKSTKQPTYKRYNRAVSLQDPLARVTKPLIKSHGFSDPTIIHQWGTIVGEQLAAVSCPLRLSRQAANSRGGATLKVRVLGAAALEFEHMTPQILERINQFYGYQAVSRITLEQGPLPLRRPRPPLQKRKLTAKEESEIREASSGIEDDDLRAAIEGLGRAIRARKDQ